MSQSDNFDMPHRSWLTIQERNRDHLQDWCDLAAALQSLRGQWKVSILVALSERDRGMPFLQQRLEMADRRVLVRALRELQRDALVARSDQVENAYALTCDGAALVPILLELSEWNKTRSCIHG